MANNTSLETRLESPLPVNAPKSISKKSLNLKYLVASDERPPYPWGWIISWFCLFLLLGSLVYWGYRHQYREVKFVHTVTAGDTLRNLALYFYQDPTQWYKIFLANRKQLLHNKKLVVGQKIDIPIAAAKLEKFERAKEKK